MPMKLNRYFNYRWFKTIPVIFWDLIYYISLNIVVILLPNGMYWEGYEILINEITDSHQCIWSLSREIVILMRCALFENDINNDAMWLDETAKIH